MIIYIFYYFFQRHSFNLCFIVGSNKYIIKKVKLEELSFGVK